MGTPSVGSATQMAFDSALPFDTSSIPVEFISETIQKRTTHIDPNGIRGTRSHSSERVRSGTETISGNITFAASRILLDNLLPMILGGSESSNAFAVAETLVTNYVMIDRGAKVFTYSDVTVSKATFRGTQGGIVEISIDVECGSETVASAGSFPSLNFPTEKPYVMSDGVLTIQSSARDFIDFELGIDNVLEADRFLNSTTRAAMPAKDRIVTLKTTHPFSSDETDLYAQAVAGAAGTLVLTNAEETDSVLTFSFAALQYPDQSPTVTGRDSEVTLTLDGVARSTEGTPGTIVREVVVTNAHA